MASKTFLLLIISLIFRNSCTAQLPPEHPLYQSILTKDSLLFDVGFNNCDIRQYEMLLSDDLQFIHDKDGVSDKTKFMYDLKNGLCKEPEKRQVKRYLLKESTAIYPLSKNGIVYGAIQNGKHIFYETPDSQPGIAEFSNVWLLEGEDYKLTTSLSFNHGVYEQAPKSNEFFENRQQTEDWLHDLGIPTLGLGLIEEGKLTKVEVYGELEEGSRAPYNTIFNVASLTKPITAMVALKLVSQGLWSLDEALNNYFTDPDIAHDSRKELLTTQLVLSHQTGFPNWRWMNESKKLEFEFDPGTAYQYSGEGFEYLRKAMEAKFHKNLQHLADELIFNPLHMHDSQLVWNQQVDSSRYAINYDENGKSYKTFKSSMPNGADDLLTTIADYGQFLISVMQGDGLDKQVFQSMQTPQVATTKGKYFGLGFEIYPLKSGSYALSHGGADKGVQTLFFILPESQKGILIFTNADHGYKAYEALLEHYLGDLGKEIVEIEMGK